MTEPTEPFTVKSVVGIDAPLKTNYGGAGGDDEEPIHSHHEILPDPETDWQPGPLPDEPTWAKPPATVQEAYARAQARLSFWRAMMRAPYTSRRRSRLRPLRERDFIRRRDPDLVCERCGKPWARARRGRGPVPRFCPDCRQASRNANG
jgi:hypothetical protein